MNKLVIITLVFLMVGCSSGTWLPMASFTISVDSPKKTKIVWNKLRIIALQRGYAYDRSSVSNKKTYNLDSEYGMTIMITENAKMGFIEMVFFQLRDDGFNDEAQKEFVELKSEV